MFLSLCSVVHKPKTVLHTIETSGIGGAEQVLLNVASRLDRRRFRSVAALPSGGSLQDALEAGGVRTHVMPSGRWWDLRLPRGLARLCRDEGVSLIHAHLPDQAFYACVAGRITGIPTVATFHGALDLQRASTWRGATKLRYVRTRARAVVAVCETVRSALVERRFERGRVDRIYNGIDVDLPPSPRTAGLRGKFGWPADAHVVGTIANVRVTKGYEYFVRAARRVVDAVPRARFVAVGDIDAELGPPILRLVEELGLGHHVKFTGFRRDTAACLREFDVFAMASTSEGFPLALLEAMAHRKAVVATYCGGPEELIRDGVNGYLVPVADPESLAKRILMLLADRVHTDALGRAAARTAAGFTTAGMVAEYEALYERILTRS